LKQEGVDPAWKVVESVAWKTTKRFKSKHISGFAAVMSWMKDKPLQ